MIEIIIVSWFVLSLGSPWVLFRFLGYCNRRQGLPEDQVVIGGEEAMVALGVVLLAPIMVPLMLVLMGIQKIDESLDEYRGGMLDKFTSLIENACNKVNSKRIKEKKDE